MICHAGFGHNSAMHCLGAAECPLPGFFGAAPGRRRIKMEDGQIVISSADRPIAWIQPLHMGGAMIAQAHGHIVLDADELERLAETAHEITQHRRATTVTPAKARLMRYVIPAADTCIGPA